MGHDFLPSGESQFEFAGYKKFSHHHELSTYLYKQNTYTYFDLI